MSERAATAVIALRCKPGLRPIEPEDVDERHEWDDYEVEGAEPREFVEEGFTERLDAACSAADEANAVFEAFLADEEAALAKWRERG